MSYAPYPAYKDSGVPWLGQVPEGWDVKRLSYATRFKGGSTPSKNEDQFWIDGTIPWVSPKDMKRKEIHDTEDHLTDLGALQSASGLIDPGHVMMVVRSGILRHSIPAAINRVPVTVNQDMRVFLPFRELKSEFIYWVIEGLQKTLVDLWSKPGTTVESLETEYVNSSPFLVPSIEEQTAIAEFLDKKTAEIDDLIAKKEELLRLLAEQRTALITHAVTKGLNPNAPMKPSGIDWLGDVPEGWEVKKIKYLVNYIGSGKTPRGGAEIYTEEGVMILRSQNIYDDGLRLKDVAYVPEEVEALQRNTRVRPGDVLLNITGASIGRSSIVPDDLPEANVNQHVCIFRSLPQKLDSRFLHAFFCSRAGKEQVSSNENGTSREGLNFQQAGNLTLALPPRELQTEIVQHLDIEIGKLDKVVRKTTHAIKRLKEFRTALITNAVTGKIKVA